MRRGFVGLGLAAVLAAAAMALAPPSLAQDKEVQLKLSLWIPPAHPLVPSVQAWAADIEKASNGTIKSTVFPSEQLGKAFDHYDMARDGIADFTYVNPGYQPGRFPIIAAGELPFLMGDAKGGSGAFDAWYRKYASSEMKDVHFCLALVHDPGTFHSHKKILVPGDLKGLKVRPADATIGQFMILLGATNVQASAPEVRDVLSRRVADAVTFPWGSIVLFGIDKVVNFHMDAALYVTTFVWVMNRSKYDEMSPAQKKVIDDHCTTEWAVKVASPWADFEADGRPKIKAETGHEVYSLTPAQLDEWRKAAAPLQDKWAENVRKAGADPDKVMAELKDALKKQNAVY
jgi:TRAP-type C4-dicarboxylate transport system substrate-binding protein